MKAAIYASDLEQFESCEGSQALFQSTWPMGLVVTPENVRKAHSLYNLNVVWAVGAGLLSDRDLFLRWLMEQSAALQLMRPDDRSGAWFLRQERAYNQVQFALIYAECVAEAARRTEDVALFNAALQMYVLGRTKQEASEVQLEWIVCNLACTLDGGAESRTTTRERYGSTLGGKNKENP